MKSLDQCGSLLHFELSALSIPIVVEILTAHAVFTDAFKESPPGGPHANLSGDLFVG